MQTTNERFRSPVLLIVLFILLTGILCAGPAGATADYAPTVTQLSPQAGYNTSALNITYLAGTYGTNNTRVTLMPPGRAVALTKKGTLANSTTVPLNGAAAVFVRGSYAYVASSVSDALEIVNIANPAAPVHVSSIRNGDGGALLDGATALFVHGNHAYVASRNSNALEIIDISSPASPVHVSAIVNGTGGYTTLKSPSAVFVANETGTTEVMAYVVSTGSNALQIIGVTNPASPTRRGNISNTDAAAGKLNTPRGIFVVGKYAYIAVNNGLEIVDVTGSWNPLEQVGFIADGTGGAYLAGASSVQVVGNYAYVTSPTKHALEIVNVTDPANPKHMGKLVNGSGGAWLDSPASVAISGIYAYVVNKNSGILEVVDVSNPALPKHKASLKLGSGYGPAGVAVSGDTVSIASSTHKSLDLVASSTGSFSATNVKAIKLYSSTRIICTLPLIGKPTGRYHVVVTNPGLQQGVLLNGFTILQTPANLPEPYPGWRGRGELNNTGNWNDGGSRPNGKFLWNTTRAFEYIDAPPVVVNGVVYVGGSDYYLYAIHANNGTVRWRKLMADNMYSAPAVANGIVYAGVGHSDDVDGAFYAFDAKNGALKWKKVLPGGSWSSPAVYKGMVITGGWDYNVTAYNAKTGAQIWRFGTGGAVLPSPAVSGGRVIVTTNDYNVFSLDAVTGMKVWDQKNSSTQFLNGLASGPAVAGGKIYAGKSGGVWMFDEKTGSLTGFRALDGYFSATPAVANKLVYVTVTGGTPGPKGNGIYALRASDLAIQWENHTPENQPLTGGVTIANGRAYALGRQTLYVWNAITGAPIWSYKIPSTGGGQSTPAVADGVVYFGTWWHDGFYALGTQHPLTLTAPDGGENWKRGTTKTIKWIYNGTPGSTVKIELLKGTTVNRVIKASTPIGAKGSGFYNWPILSNQTVGTNFLIRITSGGKVDTSNDYFTISA